MLLRISVLYSKYNMKQNYKVNPQVYKFEVLRFFLLYSYMVKIGNMNIFYLFFTFVLLSICTYNIYP